MQRQIFSFVLPAFTLGVALPAPGLAQNVGSAGILVVDMMPYVKGQPAVTRAFFINPSAHHAEDAELRARLDGITEDGKGGTEALRALIESAGGHFAKHTSNRWVSKTGDSLFVFVVRPVRRKATIDIKENPRRSRIEEDLIVAARLAAKTISPGTKFNTAAVVADTVKATVSIERRRLTIQRANVSIVSALTADSAKQSKPAEEDTVPSRMEVVLATGPREHLFMSADAAFTQARQVKYVAKTQTLEPDTDPSEFLVGFNYSAGDLLDEDKTPSVRSFLRGIYLGFLIEASKRPFNQVATVVGARRNLPGLSRVVSFNTVSPYVGAVWLRDDHRESADAGIKSRYGRANIIWGLSLNLNQALKWAGE